MDSQNNTNNYQISGNIVDIVNNSIYKGTLIIEDGKIKDIIENNNNEENYIIPGFVDAHIHIESSMLTPSEFAKTAIRHGTIATVSDPHEIANVKGIEGIRFMIENGNQVPFKFYFGAPSCVPATEFETSGGRIEAKDIEELFKNNEVNHLAEVMNFPGVLNDNKDLLEKINIAKKYNKPIDGHAPAMNKSEDIIKYAKAGITTDHECVSIEEAIEKIKNGFKILIREGSASKDYSKFIELIELYPEKLMFCSDDLHPNDLLKGHINLLTKRAVNEGYNIFKILKCASYNAIKHYNLDCGLLQKGDKADFLVINNLVDFKIKKVYIDGHKVYDNYKILFNFSTKSNLITPEINSIKSTDIKIKANLKKIKAIEIIDKSLISKLTIVEPTIKYNQLVSDIEKDLLKIVVKCRYNNSKPSVGFVKNFGLKQGAVASTVAHDSHNIIAIGTNDKDITTSINHLIKQNGGIVYINDIKQKMYLSLNIAGLMSSKPIDEVSKKYEQIEKIIKTNGCELTSPLMTLSFLALLVIPELKISDKGLFDVNKFCFTDLFEK